MGFQRVYYGAASEVRRVRADLAVVAAGCPIADELVLLASELATNAIVHTKSGGPDATFTLRAEVHQDYIRIEVEDAGGPWHARPRDDGRPHGFDLVEAIAGPQNWGIDGDMCRRIAWARLDWPGLAARG